MKIPVNALRKTITLDELVALDPPTAGTSSPSNPLRTAEVILAAFDDAPGEVAVVRGFRCLSDIIDQKRSADVQRVVLQLRSKHSNELEQLAAMVTVIHGSHDLKQASDH
jgi:hypothetical protein